MPIWQSAGGRVRLRVSSLNSVAALCLAICAWTGSLTSDALAQQQTVDAGALLRAQGWSITVPEGSGTWLSTSGPSPARQISLLQYRSPWSTQLTLLAEAVVPPDNSEGPAAAKAILDRWQREWDVNWSMPEAKAARLKLELFRSGAGTIAGREILRQEARYRSFGMRCAVDIAVYCPQGHHAGDPCYWFEFSRVEPTKRDPGQQFLDEVIGSLTIE